jgi:hypothetical protein
MQVKKWNDGDPCLFRAERMRIKKTGTNEHQHPRGFVALGAFFLNTQ